MPGVTWVVEEKLYGANAAISFDEAGELHPRSRGHYLDIDGQSPRERHFALFKTWVRMHEQVLIELLQDRDVAYGLWGMARRVAHAVPHRRRVRPARVERPEGRGQDRGSTDRLRSLFTLVGVNTLEQLAQRGEPCLVSEYLLEALGQRFPVPRLVGFP